MFEVVGGCGVSSAAPVVPCYYCKTAVAFGVGGKNLFNDFLVPVREATSTQNDAFCVVAFLSQ